jgi:hypothetical protein
MGNAAQLNKLTKGNLEDICKANNVEIPKTVKTKKDLVDFMDTYTGWTPSLEEILGGSAAAAAPTAKKAPVAKSKAETAVDTGLIEGLRKDLDALTAQVGGLVQKLDQLAADLKKIGNTPTTTASTAPSAVSAEAFASLEGKVGSLGKQLMGLDSKINTLQSSVSRVDGEVKKIQSAPPAKAAPANAESQVNARKLDMIVSEAIPEEWTYLDDVFGLLEDVSEEQFLETLRYLLAMKVIEGEDDESELKLELDDGTIIGKVKK